MMYHRVWALRPKDVLHPLPLSLRCTFPITTCAVLTWSTALLPLSFPVQGLGDKELSYILSSPLLTRPGFQDRRSRDEEAIIEKVALYSLQRRRRGRIRQLFVFFRNLIKFERQYPIGALFAQTDEKWLDRRAKTPSPPPPPKRPIEVTFQDR